MSFIQKNWQKFVLALFIIVFPVFMLYADGATCNPADGKICNPVPTITTINGLIKTLLEGLIKIGIPIVALAIVYSGFLFVFARGNSEKIKSAKDTLLYTLIGAAILLGSWAIAQLITNTVTGLSS